MSRRLLNAARTAEKLGYSRPWFSTNQAKLEAAGFPPPVLTHDEFGGARWDEKAIDLWLDARIAPALRKHERAALSDFDTVSIAEKLRGRAKELQL